MTAVTDSKPPYRKCLPGPAVRLFELEFPQHGSGATDANQTIRVLVRPKDENATLKMPPALVHILTAKTKGDP